jgi:hypothetical protein
MHHCLLYRSVVFFVRGWQVINGVMELLYNLIVTRDMNDTSSRIRSNMHANVNLKY